MARSRVDILMYHSISDASGPTSITPDIFAAQMAVLADSGVPVITMDDLAVCHGSARAAPYSTIITFDDGYRDFADTAWPVLKEHGFRPIVYLPSGFIGAEESWRGSHVPPRPIMDWPMIAELAGQGVLFGSHTITHPHLPDLTGAALESELVNSRADIEARLGRCVPHFAPPYGAATPAIRQRIAHHYATSVSTRLATADTNGDLHNLPRLEMFYFTDLNRWRDHLAGQGSAYLARRQLLRGLRRAVAATGLVS